ncbi:carbonic anhydrase 2-like isoform X2 [Oculina patagonica]
MHLQGFLVLIFFHCALSQHGPVPAGPQHSSEKQWKYGETVFEHGASINGPKDWKNISQHCVENAQSPINIDTSKVEKDSYLIGFRFIPDYLMGIFTGALVNNGHAPTFTVDSSRGSALLIGGPWGDSSVYILQQLHFHFGCEASRGSEHAVDGKLYSGELHFVTYNTKYVNFDAAADNPDGLSVIAVFFVDNGGDESNAEWQKLTTAMKQIAKADSNKKVPMNLNLYNLVPQLRDLSRTSFYSYKGSLTTPPCHQSVNWIVLQYSVSTSREVMVAMRSLHNHEGHSMCDNFRPTQPLNGRIVSKYSRHLFG